LRTALHSSMTTKFLSGIKWNEDEFDVRGHGRLLLVCTLCATLFWKFVYSQCAVDSHKDTLVSRHKILFLKSSFMKVCAKIWVTSHIKQETKQDGVTLTSFRKARGSNLSRCTILTEGPVFLSLSRCFGTTFFSKIHNCLLKNGFTSAVCHNHFFLILLVLQYNS
jgi:hypothetical protein